MASININCRTGFQQDKPYVFAVFLAQDIEVVQRTLGELYAAGFNVCSELDRLLEGADESFTEDKIKGCELVLILTSDMTPVSESAREELLLADKYNKYTVIDSVDTFEPRALAAKLPERVRFALKLWNAAAGDTYYEECGSDMMGELNQGFGELDLDAPPPSYEPMPMPAPVPVPMPPSPVKPPANSTLSPAAPMPAPPMPASPAAPSQAKRPASVRPALKKFNKVDFSVVTSEAVKPGASSLIDVFMYTKSQRRIVEEAIKRAQEKATEAARTASSVSVAQGSQVTVVLTSSDAHIEDSDETLVWRGDALDFKFRFTLPSGFKKKQADFSCSIMFDGVHITRLYFGVKVNAAVAVPVRVIRKDCRKAFVSYSHKDKKKVVEKLYAIQSVAPKLRFWMDNQSMAAGDVWRKAIASAIEKSDTFLLFWSANAKASEEVKKEWEYALSLEKKKMRRQNGARFIAPVPLESPSKCPPPKELSDLHFGDPAFDSDIEGIDEINFVGADGKKLKNIVTI